MALLVPRTNGSLLQGGGGLWGVRQRGARKPAEKEEEEEEKEESFYCASPSQRAPDNQISPEGKGVERMGSALSSEGRQGTPAPGPRGSPEGIQAAPLQLGRDGGEKPPQDSHQGPSFDCSICLEVLHQPVRTRCGHVFCHTCIATSLQNNAWTCPYCRAYLPSEGIPATDITNMMKNIYRNCTECESQVCLSEMRAHLRTCDQYIEKYGPLQEVAYPETRYPCPFCQYELDENDLLDHFLTYHRSERRQVYCPICRLLPGGGPSYYSRNFMRHLQLRHTFYYEDYIDIDVVEEVLIERVLDQSFLDYVHVNSSNVV